MRHKLWNNINYSLWSVFGNWKSVIWATWKLYSEFIWLMYWLTSVDVESGLDMKRDSDVLSLHASLIISRLFVVQSLSSQTLQFSKMSLKNSSYVSLQVPIKWMQFHIFLYFQTQLSLTKNFQILQSFFHMHIWEPFHQWTNCLASVCFHWFEKTYRELILKELQGQIRWMS